MVHTCPRCELRFTNDAELRYHFDADHHADPATFERYRYRPAATRPSGRRYLVVGNETLGDPALLAHLTGLAPGSHFHLVVPATTADGSATADDQAIGLATFRARHLVDQLHAASIDAEAEIGVADPIKAVARAIEHEHPDEIVVSVHPRGLSRWLRVDLPQQLEHTFKLPVSVVEAPS